MGQTIELVVMGKPEPRGSKVPIVLYDRVLDERGKAIIGPTGKPLMKPRLKDDGTVMLFPKDDNPRSKPWMNTIAKTARREFGEPLLTGPLRLSLHFYLERPQYHFGTGRNAGIIKDRFLQARHTVRPDRLKLARAVEDALSEVLYKDDAQTVAGPVDKDYCRPGELPRVEIVIEQLEDDGW